MNTAQKHFVFIVTKQRNFYIVVHAVREKQHVHDK